MKVIGTAEAARRLGVTTSRVRALIQAGRLKARKMPPADDWFINVIDLEAVMHRRPGRPPKKK